MNQNIDEQEKIYMEKVNPEIKENIKYIENKNEINSKNESEEKRKRRTKNDNLGRTFICKLCGKSYLSYPALYTHCKQKHNTCNSSGRGRGRPKKDNGESFSERLKYNPLDASYFLKDNRKGTTNQEDFKKSIFDAFNILYSENNYERNLSKDMNNYNNINQHPFLREFLLDKHDVNITEAKKKNKDINSNNNIEYTIINCAEDVPDLSNEFINEFLDTDKNLFDFNKEDSIDLTQNLCHWMYENNFTSSKLTLISNDNK